MTRARDFADVISGQFDLPAGSLDNAPATTDASNLTSGTLDANRLPTEIVSSDTSPQLGGELDTNSNAIRFGASKWTIELDGNNLLFKYNGTAKIKFADDGEIVTVDDVAAFGTI